MARGRTEIDNVGVGADGHATVRDAVGGACGGGTQSSGWRRVASCWSTVALAFASLAASSVQATAQTTPPGPAANRVWGGCILQPDALSSLTSSVGAGSGIQAQQVTIGFVIVYAAQNDNDGQPMGGKNFTGPIICTNPDAVNGVGIAATTQTTEIPGGLAGPGSDASSVDILDVEEAFIVRYKLNGGSNPGTIEKRVCHTTNENTDCFRISPLID